MQHRVGTFSRGIMNAKRVNIREVHDAQKLRLDSRNEQQTCVCLAIDTDALVGELFSVGIGSVQRTESNGMNRQ